LFLLLVLRSQVPDGVLVNPAEDLRCQQRASVGSDLDLILNFSLYT